MRRDHSDFEVWRGLQKLKGYQLLKVGRYQAGGKRGLIILVSPLFKDRLLSETLNQCHKEGQGVQMRGPSRVFIDQH